MAEKGTDIILMELGNKIYKLRKAHGMTQAQLADKVGMSTSAVNRIECGQRQPRLSTIQKFAECFNVDPNFLYEIRTSAFRASRRMKKGFKTVPILARIPVSAKIAETDLPSGYLKVYLPKMKKESFLFAFRMPDHTMEPHILKGDLILAVTGGRASDGDFVAAAGLDGQPAVYLYNETSYGRQFSCFSGKKSFVVPVSGADVVIARVIKIQRDLVHERRTKEDGAVI